MSYEDSIYPLQDRVLEALNAARTRFYLTGGTALSRCYFHHRYSDDLDFFVNDDDQFDSYMVGVYSILKKAGITMELMIDETRFKRIVADQTLKIDFINDVPFYLGDVQQIPGFPFKAIDNPANILANKITALRDRSEIKDLVDIREIARQMRPDWKMIFSAADSKAAGIFPPEIAEKMEGFDPSNLERITWITRPDPLQFSRDIQEIITNILSLP
jgi:predicted nucleotidyltransferase component of viral defense system